MFKRILVPLDGSRLAEAVLPVAQTFAECFGATIILFHALEQGARPTVHGERHLQAVSEAQTYLTELAARIGRAKLQVETNVHPVAEADVTRSLIEHIKELNADLIVLAEHGNSGLRN
ncbi:MAG TPA: universal stress protein, partial [Anaerolineae bacterium]